MGELNRRVAVLEKDRVVLKAALKKLHREMKDKDPGHSKVVEELEA